MARGRDSYPQGTRGGVSKVEALPHGWPTLCTPAAFPFWGEEGGEGPSGLAKEWATISPYSPLRPSQSGGGVRARNGRGPLAQKKKFPGMRNTIKRPGRNSPPPPRGGGGGASPVVGAEVRDPAVVPMLGSGLELGLKPGRPDSILGVGPPEEFGSGAVRLKERRERRGGEKGRKRVSCAGGATPRHVTPASASGVLPSVAGSPWVCGGGGGA